MSVKYYSYGYWRNDMRKVVTVWICGILLASALMGLCMQSGEVVCGKWIVLDDTQYILHAPIIIDSDSEFALMAASEGWSGNGSVENPWIIDNYEIDGGGLNNCISIRNTTVYFTVKDCYLHDSNNNLELFSVQNGTLENNTLRNAWNGILISDTFNVLVKNNKALSGYLWGITITSSRNIMLSNNTASNGHGGIRLLSCSTNNTINNNIAQKNYFNIFESSNLFYHNFFLLKKSHNKY